MWNPLDTLIITFFVMSIISILGIVFLFLTKNEKIRKILFYGLAVWGLVIAYCNALMHWSILPAFGFGGLTLAAIFLHIFGKKKEKEKCLLAARVLVAASVVLGMVNCFLI